MLQESITLSNTLGLHTRAAAKLVAVAAQFSSRIQITYRDQTADCKSIMALILLGATNKSELEFTIAGADEFEARDAIFELINNRFGEAQ